MSYNPLKITDSRSNSFSSGRPSQTDDVVAPGSPYLEFINQSFSTEQDLSLPELAISSSRLENAESPDAQPQNHASHTPRERIVNTFFKRGSKDALSSDSSSSPIIPPHSVQTRAQQQSTQQQQQEHTARNNFNNSPFQTSHGSSSSLSTSVSTPVVPKSILKQGRGNSSNNVSSNGVPPVPKSTRPTATQQHYAAAAAYQQPSLSRGSNSTFENSYTSTNNRNSNGNFPPPAVFAAAGGAAGLTRPASPFAMAYSSNNSSDNTNSLSSTYRSSRNLSLGTDPSYHLTQTDSTLEGLAQRWYAYQAMMRKQYTEDPFYRRWTKSKWILLLSTLMLLAYSTAVFAITIGYMIHKFELAVVVMEFHGNLIHLAFAGSILGIMCALVGLVGIFRENRIWLSVYTFALWPVFALYVSVGYIAFRRATSHLRNHVKDEWIHSYSRDQRLLVQRNLKCCGFQDPTWYGEYDLRCFPMINLPGCLHKYNRYEDKLLETFWTAAFSIVPFQLFVMIVALLCSNHVDGMLRSARPGLKTFREDKKD